MQLEFRRRGKIWFAICVAHRCQLYGHLLSGWTIGFLTVSVSSGVSFGIYNKREGNAEEMRQCKPTTDKSRLLWRASHRRWPALILTRIRYSTLHLCRGFCRYSRERVAYSWITRFLQYRYWRLLIFIRRSRLAWVSSRVSSAQPIPIPDATARRTTYTYMVNFHGKYGNISRTVV